VKNASCSASRSVFFPKVGTTFFFFSILGKQPREGEKEATSHELELLCKEGSHQLRDDATRVTAALTPVITADYPKA
jgi:hypothetical protein